MLEFTGFRLRKETMILLLEEYQLQMKEQITQTGRHFYQRKIM